MTTSFTRADRISGLIQKTLSDILLKDINDPRLKMITITGVKMSRDLKLARVYYSTPEEETKNREKIAQGIQSAMGYVKRTLARQLGLRYMPQLKFFYDESFDYGTKIDRLLKKVDAGNGSDSTPPNQQ